MVRSRRKLCDACDHNSKYVCPDCGGPKKWRGSTWCYPCSLLHRDTSKSRENIKLAIEAARSPEACRARSVALMGHEISEETRRKIGDSNKRSGHLVELGRRVGSSGKGRPKSAVFKQLMRERFIGSGNPMWRGGSSSNEYTEGWNEELKQFIRDRDGNVCQVCGKTPGENGRKLDVHHLDGGKTNHSPDNLIALCSSCHHAITVDMCLRFGSE